METEKEIAKTLKTLANPRRLRMIAFLKREREVTVSVIAQIMKLSVRSTSKHLLLLYSSRVVQKEQRRLEVYCSINPNYPKYIKDILDLL